MPALGGYVIAVDWRGQHGIFNKITGLRAENSVMDQDLSHPVGGPQTQKVLGPYKCSAVTFQAGYMQELTASGAWWGDLMKIQNGRVLETRGNLTVSFFDNNKIKVLDVDLIDAWPSKWSASDFSIQRAILWVETVVFQCEKITFRWA